MSDMPDPAGFAVDRTERRPVSLAGHAVLEDGSTIRITVLDLSYDGCGIASPVVLEPGTPIKLSVLQRGVIEAEIRWYSAGKAGLVFDAEDEPEEPQFEPRGERIVLATAEVALRRHGRFTYRVRAFDISPEGCKLEWVEQPEIGERMWVRVPALEALEAQVVWLEGPRAGLRFVQRIHSAVFELLVERLAAY
jgi:hypothetical protein